MPQSLQIAVRWSFQSCAAGLLDDTVTHGQRAGVDTDDSAVDPGLSGWTLTVVGTGFAGEIIDVKIVTGNGGYWEHATSYTFGHSDTVYDAQLTVCVEMSAEQIADGWHQSYPASVCYQVTLAPAALASVGDLDFGNWDEPKITVCKEQDQDATSAPPVTRSQSRAGRSPSPTATR